MFYFPDAVVHSIRYATAEVYLNKGVRVCGEVGTVLADQLKSHSSKTLEDEKGW